MPSIHLGIRSVNTSPTFGDHWAIKVDQTWYEVRKEKGLIEIATEGKDEDFVRIYGPGNPIVNPNYDVKESIEKFKGTVYNFLTNNCHNFVDSVIDGFYPGGNLGSLQLIASREEPD